MRALIIVSTLLCTGLQAVAATLDRVRETGVFTIAYRADAKPYSYRDEAGKPAGYVVELCRGIAAAVRDEAGSQLKVSYVVVSADERFQAVRDGRADILCDPSTVTLARREIVDFSIPTFLDGASVLSREAAPIERYEDLRNQRIGVLAGTTTETVLRSSLAALQIDASIKTVRDHRTGIDLLTADKIDAYFGDRGILTSFLVQVPLPGFRVAKQYFSFETYALALPRDDSAFRLLVDRTLAELYRTGKIRALMSQSLGPMKRDEILDAMFVIHALPEK